MSGNNLEVESNVFNSVVGFREAVTKKEEMESKGSNFQEQKGNVRRTIDSLHPKRLRLRVKTFE